MSNYVGLYQAAVQGLAAQPQLLQQSPETQTQALGQFQARHPDVLAVAIYDRGGQRVADAGDVGLADRAGRALLDEQGTGRGEPAPRPLPVVLADHPVILLTAPLPSGDASEPAALVGVLARERLAGLLQRRSPTKAPRSNCSGREASQSSRRGRFSRTALNDWLDDPRPSPAPARHASRRSRT